ncbi:replication protein [Acetobacter fabarum]|uniref:replication protein n=1 Tax=Acetobacter fabarum TaxID=483199 RepID=UPI0014054079|nr:replication protein [Acetobacter fabarum]NHO43332.1 replication protein [Acetobacter fabarum]
MTDEHELDDGLAAFDQLGREMAETNRLLRAVRSDQATRNQQEHALSVEMQTALKQATGASQKALQASQTKIRASLLWAGLTAFLIVLVAFGGGYFFGHWSGWDTGHADGYQKARNQEAAASWANTPAGQRAYALDQLGSLDLVSQCMGHDWQRSTQNGKRVCFPQADAKGNMAGWYLP